MLADPDGAAAPSLPRPGLAATPPAASTTAAADRVPASQKIGFGLGSFLDMWGHWLRVGRDSCDFTPKAT